MPETEQSSTRQIGHAPSRPAGMRGVVYWGGRGLQGAGLLVLWWVLLLFAGDVAMGPLLFGSALAGGIFYAGWLCTVWGRQGCQARGRNG